MPVPAPDTAQDQLTNLIPQNRRLYLAPSRDTAPRTTATATATADTLRAAGHDVIVGL